MCHECYACACVFCAHMCACVCVCESACVCLIAWRGRARCGHPPPPGAAHCHPIRSGGRGRNQPLRHPHRLATGFTGPSGGRGCVNLRLFVLERFDDGSDTSGVISGVESGRCLPICLEIVVMNSSKFEKVVMTTPTGTQANQLIA